MHVLRQRRQNGSQIKKLMLNTNERGAQFEERRESGGEILNGGARNAEVRIQFIHRAVAFNAEVILGHSLATDQARLARIPTASVDAVQRQTRLAKGFVTHRKSLSRV